MSSGALESPDLLLSYSMIAIALNNTIILIIIHLSSLNKYRYEKEIQPLITHFHKLEMLKDKSANKQELKAKLEQENQGMLSGFLGGIAQNMVMTKKAVSKKNVFSDE